MKKKLIKNLLHLNYSLLVLKLNAIFLKKGFPLSAEQWDDIQDIVSNQDLINKKILPNNLKRDYILIATGITNGYKGKEQEIIGLINKLIFRTDYIIKIFKNANNA